MLILVKALPARTKQVYFPIQEPASGCTREIKEKLKGKYTKIASIKTSL
jgi:hypothetical protein